MLISGCNFLKKSFFDQSLEDFYKEARDKFELRFGLKAAVGEPVLCEDLNILRSRHMGAFGQALIVQHKKNKIHFVMKLTNKKEVLKERNVDSLLKEKKILEACNFPFILKLAHCIQDKDHLLMLYQLKPSEDYFR